MAITSNYPGSLDSVFSDVASGNEVRVDDWNRLMDEAYQLERWVGHGSTASTSAVRYVVQGIFSYEPGHRHNLMYANDGTTICLSGGSTQQVLRIGAVTYQWPTSAPLAAAWLLNDGAGALTWTGMIARSSMTGSADQVITTGSCAKRGLEQIVYTATATGDIVNDRIYPGVVGYYLAIGATELGAVADTKYSQAVIQVNGTAVTSGSAFKNGAAGDAISMAIDLIYIPTIASYVELFIYNQDASNRTSEGAYNVRSNRLQLVGPL
jgi:hypothetical protein